jgi:F420-0:gamma-glutamyl ligase
MSSISATAVKTDLFEPEMDLFEFIVKNLGDAYKPKEGSILAITSKILSLAEDRRVSVKSTDKGELVRREADTYLGEIGYGCHLTIKHGLFIPSAGIDESNSNDGSYILYPEAPYQTARSLHKRLREHFGIRRLGVIITDSHTTPLRRGVTGIALAYWGIKGTRNLIGRPDLFGRPLKMTQINLADAVATAAVFVMGEADERQPLAVVHGVDAEFVEETDPTEIQIPMEEDLYAPLFSAILNTNDSL